MTGKEIYDLAWSPSGQQILAGSVDHTATIYDVSTGTLFPPSPSSSPMTTKKLTELGMLCGFFFGF